MGFPLKGAGVNQFKNGGKTTDYLLQKAMNQIIRRGIRKAEKGNDKAEWF